MGFKGWFSMEETLSFNSVIELTQTKNVKFWKIIRLELWIFFGMMTNNAKRQRQK